MPMFEPMKTSGSEYQFTDDCPTFPDNHQIHLGDNLFPSFQGDTVTTPIPHKIVESGLSGLFIAFSCGMQTVELPEIFDFINNDFDYDDDDDFQNDDFDDEFDEDFEELPDDELEDFPDPYRDDDYEELEDNELPDSELDPFGDDDFEADENTFVDDDDDDDEFDDDDI